MHLSSKHLLGIRDLLPEDIHLILDTAKQFKEVLQRPIKKVPSLRDITIVNLFYENSTRTRISFELAEKRLSADTINFSASGSSVSKGETLLDTVNNILSMKVDMVVMRHSATGAPHFLANHIPAAIINAGDGINEHPTQALLDAMRRIQLERQNQVLFSSLREYNQAYGITKQLLQNIQKEILIMHPGPINRGVEIDSDVADSGQSIILDQVENGVAVRMAVLYLLSGRKEASA